MRSDNNASSAFDEFTKLLYNSSLFKSKPADPFPELIRLIISFNSVEVDSKFSTVELEAFDLVNL